MESIHEELSQDDAGKIREPGKLVRTLDMRTSVDVWFMLGT